MSQFIITDALVLPMTEERKSFEGFVRFKDGIITEVAPGRARELTSDDEQVIDGKGRVLMPGLINAHTHLYQVLLRAVWEDLPLLSWLERIYGAAQVLTPEHFYAGSLLGCAEAIHSGVTTVCEHNFLNPHPDCAFESIRAIGQSGLRAVFARTVMDSGEIVPACVKEKPEQAFRHIEKIVRACAGERRLSIMTGPNTPPLNTTPELLKAIRRFASEQSLGISAHVAESRSVVEFTRDKYGKSGVVEFLDEYGIPGPSAIFAHAVHISESEIQILKESGSSVSHNPVSNMMLGDGIAPVIEMLKQGVNVALGTDGAASNHSQDLFETMKCASLLQKVHHQDAGAIEPYKVLRMATSGGAGALGLSSVCGTLEIGKKADLILIELQTLHQQPVNDIFSQIVHCAKAGDVRTVIVDGEVIMKERDLTSLDVPAILYHAKKANVDLMRRLSALT